MDNKGKLHEWDNERISVNRSMSMFDTVLSSTLTECQDEPTHDLSLAPYNQVQVSGIVSGEVTPYDITKRWNLCSETAN